MSADKRGQARQLCEEALSRIDEAIEQHSIGRPADLSEPMLREVRREIEDMHRILDPAQFSPEFGRFLLDWPNKHGLVAFLQEVAYLYSRIGR